VLVQVLIVVRGNVTARVLRFDPTEKTGVHGHHVFVVAVQRAILHHPDLAVAFHNLRFDLADLFMHQVAPIFLSIDDRFARFLHTCGTQRIRLPRETQRRLGLFPGLQQRLVRPLWCHRRIRIALVEKLYGVERQCGRLANHPIHGPEDLRPHAIRHKPLASTLQK